MGILIKAFPGISTRKENRWCLTQIDSGIQELNRLWQQLMTALNRVPSLSQLHFSRTFQGLFKDENQIFQENFFIYRAEGTICNDQRSLFPAADSLGVL